jgi:uncharacterized protein (DUF1778 family)
MHTSKQVTSRDLIAALNRARAFLEEQQFIAADKNLARCFLELYDRAAIQAAKDAVNK